MNIQPVNNQPVSDDNDLAKVLSGADGDAPAAPAPEPEVTDTPVEVAPEMPPLEETPPSEPPVTTPAGHEELEAIKKEALEELKPLVDKLELPPEEKFDILLLIIRSCDDEELVDKAHKTATEIVDETRKAQALLDIIKEVDYFSNK
ncbi:MAG: hypothetical protein Q7T74_03555 [Candidatus Saccharibacteria bacterium]|nr:hypothetical protein [Candidatus Saccharibacteria bacterium]